MILNAYIHIPFCKSKCKYCSFVSYPDLSRKEMYLRSLKSEIEGRYGGECLETLYFGGGTPSVLTVKELDELIKLFDITRKTEVTAELNPDDADFGYLKGLKAAGVNRVSFGCQSFDDEILKNIGRRHLACDVKNAVENAFSAGFENINLDLIYGLPNLSLKGFEKDLENAINLKPSHISLYGLKISEGCYYYDNPPENIADDDLQADMYLKAIEILSSNGFEHYEISNFARKGFVSNHNINYWNNNSYYGFGVSAHGYENGVRYSNTCELEKYINSSYKPENSHKLTRQEKLEEEIFLGFRLCDGIDVQKINEKYSINFSEKYNKILEKYKDFIIKSEKGYKLTNEGILISNTILSEFLA